MSDHAHLSPSNTRWPYCPGSVIEESNYPDIAGEAAIDGTGSHILLEMCLINNVPASDYDKLIIGVNHADQPAGWLVDEERCKRVQIALDYVTRRKKELSELFPGCKVIVESESKSNPGFFFMRNDWWGTCDITITAMTDADFILFIEVVDYKDGRGYVSEKSNTQLISYLFGKMQSRVLDIGMRMTIVQPKTGTPIRYMCSTNPDHGLTMPYLISKVDWLADCAAATDEPDAPLIPGSHCQWCKHNPKRGGTCTKSTEKSMEVIDTMTITKEIAISANDGLLEFITKAVSDVKSLSPEQLAKVADSEDGFKAAFDKVKAEIQERIETDIKVPGYAMLPGRASKIWNESEDIIVKKLKAKKIKKDQIYPAKLITPAAALKIPGLTEIQKNKIANELISEVAGSMTLKKVEYDHAEMKNVNTMFENVDEPKKEEVSFF
jgi:hypothetical protein